ncbi:SusD/RagB family nutrient-binding outer membrane lipoprotein [Flavobacterium sp. KACC 22761]|uniref:SusD/RagB family nutrient-binding outer membrane lipoprotein n=1 Tax=Flavobacterium sp. KACC 22761 TaxID=3092665 RepID=UPI002A750BD0|nr:SusD/RagB family nutrient-binding outer membrane lipoprotein [Flavobacterium sp. KACC 22761]WPO79440.1 SusD/RagB family nutrient-binding outer membrane lipoprotein [Flavobacterium sp. KACC 22761]
MKKIVYFLSVLALTSSCSDLTDLNVDEKNPSEVPASSLFTSAQKGIAEQVVNTSVNKNIFRLVNQQWTETTYIDESVYQWTTRNISGNHWNAYFAGTTTNDGAIYDLVMAKSFLEKEEILASDPEFETKTATKKNQLALIDILTVYTYQILVDTFGDIPYSEALKGSGNYLPKYDKAVDIYKDLIVRLDNNIKNIQVGYPAFGSADVVYRDNMVSWIKFANSVKLKLGVNLKASGLESAIADAAILSASKNVFTSNADNAKISYESNVPNTNPLYVDLVFGGRHDFVPAKPFVDAIVAKNDPRTKAYFAQNLQDENGNPLPYKGGVIGVKNSFGKFTHISDKIQEPNFPGTYLDYAEVEFLLAEAAERGIAIAGSAASHYSNAIKASMEDWGVSEIEANNYLSQPSVAYATATGTWQQKIGEQAWYAMYNRGFEGWTFARRLNFPALLPPPNADAAANGQIPSRMTYPIREQTLNATNYNAAANAIGGDKLYTKLFWDKD